MSTAPPAITNNCLVSGTKRKENSPGLSDNSPANTHPFTGERPVDNDPRPASKKVMVTSAKEDDSNMTITNNNGPFVADKINVKPTIDLTSDHAATWERIRAEILRRSPPHLRFRATWDGFGNNPRGSVGSQKEMDTIIVLVRALGKGQTEIDKPDTSLYSALAELKIKPKMVTPSTSPQPMPFFFLHAKVDIEGSSTGSKVGNKLTSGTSCQLTRRSLEPWWVSIFGFVLTFSPVVPSIIAFRLWRNPGTYHILGRVCGLAVRLEPLPACTICGAEDHDGARCSYKDLLDKGPQPAIVIDNKVMELSPTSIPKKKKKAVRIEPEAPVTTHVYHPVAFRVAVMAVRQVLPIVESRVADLPAEEKRPYNDLIDDKELTSFDISDSSDSPTPKIDCYALLKSMSKK
ncbi:hypothetical protein MJO28_012067 [Puccinia striiformis f. sp. tritici]|uniref:Uncharacterized protein n=1 Tax=Puccinia striiformis f. sp. tritici TaxID=168172 RepID=A0ACC0DYX0_9BASI|nr:hypothetical protein MJO28_012067 [Puccinia striiformis f. sp. tritici]